MSIRASLGKQIDGLIADLAAPGAISREVAIARLTVIGARAVERLIGVAGDDAFPAARIAALQALAAIADPRGLEPALHGLAHADAGVAAAATAVVRVFVTSRRGAEAVDGLTRTALDRARPTAVRVAALRALQDLAPSTIAPLLKSLKDDPNDAVRAEAARKRGQVAPSPYSADVVARVTEGELPDSPAMLKDALTEAGDRLPLPVVLRIIELVRAREEAEPAAGRPAWATTRAAAHLLLARRASRIGLYDLRESLERSTKPLPVDVLTALRLVGDASCLESIAAAHARATDVWWRDHLVDAFRAILKREKLTKRHAAVKKIARRWPKVLSTL